MVAIELGGQVVQCEHRLLASRFGVKVGLRQQGRERGELGLAARQGVAARDCGEGGAPVGPVRTDTRVAGLKVPVAGEQQGIGQRKLVATPAG